MNEQYFHSGHDLFYHGNATKKKKKATGGKVINDNPIQPVWAVYSEYHFEFMNSLFANWTEIRKKDFSIKEDLASKYNGLSSKISSQNLQWPWGSSLAPPCSACSLEWQQKQQQVPRCWDLYWTLRWKELLCHSHRWDSTGHKEGVHMSLLWLKGITRPPK